jgi:hypothetical protein
MDNLEFLTVTAASQASLQWPDVYFSPSYGHACEASDRCEWEVAVGAGGRIIFPYLKRQIDPRLSTSKGDFDVVSPYGYSGTWVAPGVDGATVASFREALRSRLAARGGVAEFHRCSGLVPGLKAVEANDTSLRVERLHDTVAIDLTRGYDACWAAAEGRSRTKTRKARKKGYVVEHRVACADDLCGDGVFRQLYDSTMKRVGASAYYLFPDAYYERLAGGLGDRLGLVEVRGPDGSVGCIGLYFVHAPGLHLHLVGNTREAQRDGAGNMLYDSMISWGCARGLTFLHIGGGLEPDDRLFFFKRSFGGHRVPFSVARGVLDPAKYASLVAARAEATDRTVEELKETGYFPAYRG